MASPLQAWGGRLPMDLAPGPAHSPMRCFRSTPSPRAAWAAGGRSALESRPSLRGAIKTL